MVHNPIYDGPIYDSVHLQFESLTAATRDTEQSSNSSCHQHTTADNSLAAHYVDKPIILTSHIQKRPSSSHTHNSAVSDIASQSESGCMQGTLTEDDGEEQRKLHLTIPIDFEMSSRQCMSNAGPSILTEEEESTGPGQESQNSALRFIPLACGVNPASPSGVEEMYTLMSPTGTITGSLWHGWSETKRGNEKQEY